MIRILLLIFFIPIFGYTQNIVTIISMDKVVETQISQEISEYELYKIKISPGYKDHSYKIILIKFESTGKEIILSQPEINVELIVHRKEYKMPDGKYEWDFETEVKSNDTWTDEYIEVGDCSNSKHLKCLLRVKKTERYKVKVDYGEKESAEFLIGK